MYQPNSDHLNLPGRARTEELRAQLETVGYVVLPAFANTDLLDALRAEVDSLGATPAGELEGTVICRDSQQRVLDMHYLDRHSDLLFDLARLPEMQLFADRLLGSRSVPFLSEFFGNPGVDSDPTPPHQDQIFHRDHFGTEVAIAVWLAVTDIDAHTGDLQYATEQPSTGELLKHREFDVVNFGAELVDDALSYVSAPVPAGGAVIHHSYTVHRRGPMYASSPRIAVALNYRRSPYREHLNPLAAS